MLRRLRRVAARTLSAGFKALFPEHARTLEVGLNRRASQVYEFGERYRILEFADCTVWPHFSVATDRMLFSETVLCPDKLDWLAHRLRLYPTVKMSGCVTSLGDIWHNYYHRYVDIIPKVQALHLPALRKSDISLILTSGFRKDDLRVLSALLPSNVRIRRLPRYVRVSADTYLHLPRLSTNPSKPCKTDSSIGFLPDAYLTWYRDTASKLFDVDLTSHDTGRNVYISRRRAGKRKIINEDELLDALRTLSFEVVYLEELPLREQIALFSEASVIIAQHGAALTNILYASPGSTLVELVSSNTGQEIHYSLGAEKLGMQYHRVHLQTVDGRKDADGIVDVAEVLGILGDSSRESVETQPFTSD